MGHPGFSWVGALFLLALLFPNLLWTKRQPAGYDPSGESKLLLTLERVGQVLAACIALLFRDFNWRPWTAWSWWLVGAVMLMVLYELWWARYFRSRRTLDDFYSSFLGVPAAGATLPVLAFFLLGIYGRVLWMLPAAAALGVGHIGIHLQHRNQLSERKETTYE